MPKAAVGLIILGFVSIASAAPPVPIPPILVPPKMTPALYPRVVEKHEIVTEVTSVLHNGKKGYHIMAAFLVDAPHDRVRKELLNFPKYRQLSKYITRSEYDPREHAWIVVGKILSLE